MKPITITNWGLLYISLGFVAFVYAVPDNIMSYGLAQNLVELTANIVPVMEKLRQAYEQQYVTGITLFFHALGAILPIITKLAKDQKRRRSYQERVKESEAAVQTLDARVGFTKSEYHRQVIERLEEAGRKQVAVRKELIKARARVDAQTISFQYAQENRRER